MSRTLDALVPMYGAKRQMADRIIEELGDHKVYWENFCGSLATTLAKPPCRMEVVNDLNKGLVNLARVVAGEESADLFCRLYQTAFAENLYEESVTWLREHQPHLKGKPDTAWAYHYFMVAWQGRNGLVGTVNELDTGFCKRFTSNGGDPATRFKNVVERIPSWWNRLRNVTILNEDGISLLERIEDKEGTVIYCDPPYLDKQARYLFDFARGDQTEGVHPLVRTYGDHGKLALALHRFEETKVVVSYYDHPSLDELYTDFGWSKTMIDGVPKNLAVRNGPAAAPEVLLKNRR